MEGRANVLIVGKDEGTLQYVSRMGFCSVVVNALDDAAKTLGNISPAFVLVNLLNGDADPRVLHELSGTQVRSSS